MGVECDDASPAAERAKLIIRIRRARCQAKDDARLFGTIRSLVDGRPRPEGLLDLLAARRHLEDGRVEHTIISLWDGPEVLDGGSIPDWDLGPGSTNPAIDADSTLEQLELEADDWPGFVAMVKARSGRMS